MNALFLGYGKMGSALGESWYAGGLVERLVAVDPGLPRGMSAEVVGSAADLVDEAFDVIVLAVKPAVARQAIASLPTRALSRAVLISVMAGVSCAQLCDAAGKDVPVVRAMPNTPVMVNQGCTGLYSVTLNDAAKRRQVKSLFDAVGVAVWLEREGLLDAVTAISGSGPAYYHLFSEALCNAGIELGLPAELARVLAAHTARGAAELQCKSDVSFVALREAVTSANGTTAAAIAQFEAQDQLRRLVNAAAQAAHDRSIELSRQG
ncbi:pyrroline-5-carboxylate reductase [Pseudomonas sp. MWU13-2105]|uniref:pyrroline-5-carboxylate reductase n=1 Tax=Pseudomonas sp. MWU13-2105 TaxID=2935074 RepID=UPI00200BF6CE|nr:pyrroline-5-carboxylate reductase [Pseudomonas sp. MWU13-2105]